MSEKNEGINVRGDISGGQFAVGVSGGQVNQYAASAAPGFGVEAELERLRAFLDEHGSRLDEGEEAKADLEDVREQAAKDKPDKRRLTDTLKRLTERVSAVGALALAVKDIADKLGVSL
jgi:hypothetical protein